MTLSQHVEDVAIQVSASSEKVILVGHSYAGMIISGVAEAVPDKLQRLVFVDGFIPEDGQSVLDLLPLGIAAYFRQTALDQGDGWRLPGGDGNWIYGTQAGQGA